MSRFNKAIAAVVGFLASLIAAGVIDAEQAQWVQAGIAALTAAGVYGIANKPEPRDPNVRA